MPTQTVTLTLTVNTGGYYTYWSNTGGLLALGGTEASQYHQWATTPVGLTLNTDAASAIPSGGIILGVETKVYCRKSSAYAANVSIAPAASGTMPNQQAIASTTTDVYTFGGPTDKSIFSDTASLASFNLNVNTPGGTQYIYVDYVEVKVYVDVPLGTAVDLTFTNISSIFSNPNNIKVEDGAYSSRLGAPSGTGTSINIDTNASSVIPGGNVIYGVIITVKGYVTGTDAVGNSYISFGSFIPYGVFPGFPNAANTKYTYGASDNTLGITSPYDLDSIMFIFRSYATGPINYYVDFLKITVYYGPPLAAGGGGTFFFGENF